MYLCVPLYVCVGGWVCVSVCVCVTVVRKRPGKLYAVLFAMAHVINHIFLMKNACFVCMHAREIIMQ